MGQHSTGSTVQYVTLASYSTHDVKMSHCHDMENVKLDIALTIITIEVKTVILDIVLLDETGVNR
jgi:hypothetical protein